MTHVQLQYFNTSFVYLQIRHYQITCSPHHPEQFQCSQKSCVKGTIGFPPGLNLQGLEADGSSPCGAEVKDEQSDIATPTHALMFRTGTTIT